MEIKPSTVIEVTVLIAGMGVAWGVLHTEVATIKQSNQRLESTVVDIRDRLIRVEDALPTPAQRRRERQLGRDEGAKK